jgi:hypothetical protein
MDIKMTLNDFTAMLNKLYVSYIIDRVNNDIIHIELIKGNDIFRLRFVNEGFDFEFTNFLEG